MSRRVALAVAMIALLSVVLASSHAVAQAPTVWEMTPYQVRAIVAVAPQAGLSARWQSDLLTSLLEQSTAVVGAPWQFEAEAAEEPLQGKLLESLDSLRVEDLPTEMLDTKADKLLFVTIVLAPEGWLITARDFDLATRQLGTPISRVVSQRGELQDEAFRVLWQAFSPLARIDSNDARQARLSYRAGALPMRDSSLTLIRPGTLLRPVIVVTDSRGNTRRAAVEWTFLRVATVDGARAVCDLQTGLRSPLAPRRRGRVEPLALVVHPPSGSTRLQLVAREGKHRPLGGYDVYAYSPPDKSTTLLGRSDANGMLHIPPVESGLRVLLVKHGGELMAKLPVVPGLTPTLVSNIPDDDRRLEAEALVTSLQESFVDLVARRQMLLARARSRLDDEQFDETAKLLETARQLISQDQLMITLRQERRRLTSSDPLIQAKIKRLFDDTEEAVKRFLDTRELDELDQELKQARATAAAPGNSKT